MPDPVRSPKDVLADANLPLDVRWLGPRSVEVSLRSSEAASNAALSALRSAGYRVVPEEPTLDMIEKASDAMAPHVDQNRDYAGAEAAYRAALAAWEEQNG